MKLPENTVEVQSNMVFDEVHKVTIASSDKALAMVIERLISTYDNPYRAALREYTSNAYDEHIQAGVTRPVEVNLPHELAPELSVRDFGRGLTREELKGYGTIGESTKQDSNDTTGGFGMGSKCALAAAPSFTVTSVKDGKRNTVIVARDANNVPHMNFLAEVETTDEPGTVVTIPISDVNKFGDLTDFWIGWKPGSLLVDDEEPKGSVYDTAKYRQIKNFGWYNLANVSPGRDMIRVLINQVYYELPYTKLGLTYTQWNILKYYVVKIDNGSVDIAPSRETLLFNARTTAAVTARTQDLLTMTAKDRAQAVTNAPDLKTALQLREKMLNSGFPVDGIKFQGKGFALPGETLHGNRIPDLEGTWAIPYKDYNVKHGFRVDKTWANLSNKRPWTFTETNKFVIVHSADAPTSYGKYGRRQAHREAFGVAEYLSTRTDSRFNSWNFFFTSEPLKNVNRHFRDLADMIISGEDFRAVVKEVRKEAAKEAKAALDAQKATRKLKIVKFSSYGGVNSADEITAEELKNTYKHVIFFRNQDGGMGERFRDALMTKINFNRTWNSGIHQLVRKYDAAIVLIGKNDKVDDLKSVLPPVTTVQELAVKAIKETYVTATKWDLMALRDREEDAVSVFRNLNDDHLSKIKNKQTVKWAKSVRDFRDTGAAARSNYEWLAPYFQEVKDAIAGAVIDRKGATLPETPMKRYPLLRAVYSGSAKPEDIIDYVNLRDKALKG